ncbi:hypothetical protein [Kribbella qitaiheensis]|nr:hypothetical protein [Kribbella qitaiheensis]
MSEKVITASRATSSTAGFRMISARSLVRDSFNAFISSFIEYETSHTM